MTQACHHPCLLTCLPAYLLQTLGLRKALRCVRLQLYTPQEAEHALSTGHLEQVSLTRRYTFGRYARGHHWRRGRHCRLLVDTYLLRTRSRGQGLGPRPGRSAAVWSMRCAARISGSRRSPAVSVTVTPVTPPTDKGAPPN
jgi:hypothetical protein